MTGSILTYSLVHKQFCWSGVGARSSSVADPNMQPHRHSFFQIFFVAAGTVEHRIGDRSFQGGAGSIFFISPYTVHHVSFPPESECYVLYFGAEFLQDEFTASESAADELQLLRHPELAPFAFQSHCSYQLAGPEIAEARERCLRIQDCCQQKGPYDAAQARAELTLLLVTVAKKYAATFAELRRSQGAVSVVDCRARAAVSYIQAHFQRPLTLGEVAAHVHLTGTYLTHLLKQELGRSFKQILDEVRLENCKNLLAYTDTRMQRVAIDSGFLDQAHFSRRFKAYTQLTPGQFRRQHQVSTAHGQAH